MCSSICKPGLFTNISTKKCDLCHSTCYTCDSGQLTSCLTCKDGWKLGKQITEDKTGYCYNECHKE